ncbi:hypothetical protein [Sandaracinus amylolyticus]|uniref:hypothetical protein n=1 Tax=Sandaracinus amylolyticus TaxID=927083 RepID=UPI001F1D26D6|nr:hypothetical protein [Sandaracinus amylolyticus]UJR82544.1 Hypothetical protein I5071_46090 [Sandaracinus amylolyticus]
MTAARDLDDVITDALRELGLPEDLRDEVRARVDAPDESWRTCCGGFCDPCVTVIARVVDRVRALRRQRG